MSCGDSEHGLAVIWTLVSPNANYTVAVSGTGVTRTVTITMNSAGYYLFKLWLIDTASNPGLESAFPTSGEARTNWEIVTTSAGVITKTFTHNGSRTWYLATSVGGVVAVSDALAFTA